MNPKHENNMETVLTRIRSEFGLRTMANGKTLISIFCDLSQVKQDQRLLRYLVEVDGHKALLEMEKLSSAMQQTRFQQTVNKLCTEMLVSEEAARQVCTAFYNAVYGNSAVHTPPQSLGKENVRTEEHVRVKKESCQPEASNHRKNPKTPEPVLDILPRLETIPQKTKTSGSKAGIGMLITALLMAVLFLPALLKKEIPSSVSYVQTQEAAPKDAPEEVSLSEYIQRKKSENGSRVLKADPFQNKVDNKGNRLTYPAFDMNLMRDQIASITFLNTLRDAPSEVVDLSEAQDGSVLSWVVSNGNLFDLYIAAEGGVKAPIDSSGLFAWYVNAKSISFNNSFDTSRAVSMHMMFYDCDALEELDLSGINTGNAKTMDFLFAGCDSLTSVDVSRFDTSNVTSFSSMFDTCTGLKSLELGNFDTSNAVNMHAMFKTCWGLETLDLSGFNTEKVTDMGFMFCGCRSLTDLDISSFDTTSVADMMYMFKDTEKIQNLDLSGFDISNVTEYRHFMNDGMQINGRSWEKFFTS